MERILKEKDKHGKEQGFEFFRPCETSLFFIIFIVFFLLFGSSYFLFWRFFRTVDVVDDRTIFL